ncbi:MAG: Ldh family oxidoreductase [Bacillota bacterium]|nr:Ldh family oxidoreductase [Bacillota bacterium]
MDRIRLTERQSRKYVSGLFQHMGCSPAQAEIIADHLTCAEMRGLASHGLSRIPFYIRKLRNGGYNPTPNFSVLKETLSTALVDADDGIGLVSGSFAMQMCIEKARSTGCAAVSVTHANHIGYLGYYSMMAAREDMIGLTICNAGASTAVWGTTQPVLGTDPLAIAVPTMDRPMLVFDAATSVVAQGKVAVAQIEGRPIPGHWAFDQHGQPTTDASEALRGSMRPFGDYKGSGLAIMIALITAGLGDVAFDMEEDNLRRILDDSAGSDLADLFVAIDISAFVDADRFKRRADQLIDRIKAFAPAPGFEEILMPGEIEHRKYQAAQAEGFTIDDKLRTLLERVNSSEGFSYDTNAWPIDAQQI